jgi:hypothetical protein
MGKMIKLGKERNMLASTLPEKAEIPVLQHRVEIVLTRGVKMMEEILETDPCNETKIRAFNSLVGLGRYIEVRKENEYRRKEDDYLEDDLGYGIGEVDEEA